MRLSIGDFARASGLTPKALRLYDELGLLAPAWVDPFNGYRWYEPDQLDRACLVARLRLLGMPLVQIRSVVALSPGVAADQVAAFWRQAEADLAARRGVVTAVVDELRTKEHLMTSQSLSDGVHLTARVGFRLGQGARPSQEEALHAGHAVFAVADGFGRSATGTTTSAALAISTLAALDREATGTTGGTWHAGDGDPAAALGSAVSDAVRLITAEHGNVVAPHPGTTLTGALLTGSTLHVVHLGDTRLWLVRDGRATLLTRDHNVLSTMVEDGRLTPDEVRLHPDRGVLTRAILPAGKNPEMSVPDVVAVPVRPGDRVVLAADGVHAELTPDVLAGLLVAPGSPDQIAAAFADSVERAGAPDNYSVVVAELDLASSAA